MDKKTRQQLLDRYAALDRTERAKLDQKAREMRSRTLKSKVRDRNAYEDEEAPNRRVSPLLEPFLLKLLAEETTSQTKTGTVVGVARGRATVEIDGERKDCTLASHLIAAQQTDIAVGDIAMVADGIVRSIGTRKSSLTRSDPSSVHGRVIAANVDVVVVVVSVVSPPLHPRIIDRYLIAIARGGAEPLVAVNKIDLGDEELELLKPYAAAGIAVVPVSAGTGQGMDELKAHLAGKTSAFVGHSGVGKSSLMNAYAPEIGQVVGEVSETYGRGTHTTRTSSLFDLGGGTRLIDTPGVRSFGLGKMTQEELSWGFPEFEDIGCRLRGCTHSHEPGCAVRAGVERGELSEFRYETYLGLLEDVG